MRRVTTIRTGDNREVRGVLQDFEIDREDWNSYKLLDGGVVRLKTTVSQIFRLVDDNDKPIYGPDGAPAFLVKHKPDVVAIE